MFLNTHGVMISICFLPYCICVSIRVEATKFLVNLFFLAVILVRVIILIFQFTILLMQAELCTVFIVKC